MDHIHDLVARLEAADGAYFNSGEAILEDAAYDALKADLARLAPNHPILKRVGAEAPAGGMLERRRHTIPMGSQDKVHNLGEFQAWIRNTLGGVPHLLHASLKLDGCSIVTEYPAGTLGVALTRGGGVEGEIITSNAVQFRGVPRKTVLRGQPVDCAVRGEAVLHVEDWPEVDPDMLKNPRNAGNGVCRRMSGAQSDLINFYSFGLFSLDGTPLASTEEETENMLREMGFSTSPSMTGSADEVWAWFERVEATRATLPYWIDGVVVKVNDIATQVALGVKDTFPKGQIALKFKPATASTVLRSVTLSVGHTGAIIPTGAFDPVELGGTTNSTALLCNWAVIQALDIAVGDTIDVYRAGEIIPKVMRVTCRPVDRQVIAVPTACPVCGGAVGRKSNTDGEESAALYCLNDDCSAKLLKKINRFVCSLRILGVGPEVLAGMVGAGVRDVSGLFRLQASDLEDIKLGGKVRLGRKRADKIIAEIEKRRALTLAEFLGSLGIDGLGKRRVDLIRAAVPGQLDAMDDWLHPSKIMDLAVEAGIPNLAAVVHAGLQGQRDLIGRLIEAGVRVVPPVAVVAPASDAKSFCITGDTEKPRAVLHRLITEAGQIVKKDVSAGLTYLVMADPDSTSGKANRARELGTRCISEAALLEILATAKPGL